MSDDRSPPRTAGARPPADPPPASDRIGELLARVVRLTRHDVYEILAEQANSGQRFGQVALQWGLCKPAHVRQARASQLAGRTPRTDLAVVGLSTPAPVGVPPRLAASPSLAPIRSKVAPRPCAGERCKSKCRGDACPSRPTRADRPTGVAVA